MIDNLIMVKIHQNSIYIPQSLCAHIGNVTFTSDPSIQSCIWECNSVINCQTAIYYENEKICSMFIELNTVGRVQPSGSTQASVICHRKNHDPIATCPTTTPTTTSSTTASACPYFNTRFITSTPSDLTGYRLCVGENFTFTVTGSLNGPVWGTDIYTDDSSLAHAAVHAGVVQNQVTENITVIILPGQSSYTSFTRYGVSSSSYGSWPGSYCFP